MPGHDGGLWRAKPLRAAKFYYRRKRGGDLVADRGEHFRTLADRVGDINAVVVIEMRPEISEVCNAARILLGNQPCCFEQREGAPETLRSYLEHGIPVGSGHGQNEVGTGRYFRGEAPGSKVRSVTTECNQHTLGILVNRVPDNRSGARARRVETGDPCRFCHSDGQAFGRG